MDLKTESYFQGSKYDMILNSDIAPANDYLESEFFKKNQNICLTYAEATVCAWQAWQLVKTMLSDQKENMIRLIILLPKIFYHLPNAYFIGLKTIPPTFPRLSKK